MVLGREYSFSDLEMLTIQYPYAYAFRLMLVAEMKKRGDVRLPSELRTAAMYAPDRRALYDYVERDAKEAKEEKQKQTPTPPQERPKQTTTTGFDIESMLQDMPDITTENKDEGGGFSEIDAFLNKAEKTGGKLSLTPQRVDVEEENEPLPEPIQKQDASEPFSETLAKIYIKQHKYEKAIKTFQKLMTKYPEKSVYFADQIRFLEKLIENL